MRCRRGDVGMVQQVPHQKPFVAGHIFRHHAQKIVPLPRHGMSLHDVRPGRQIVLEGPPIVRCMRPHAHLAHYVDAPSHGLRIDQPDRRLHDLRLLQRLDPAPAGCGRGTNLLSQSGMAKARVILENAQQAFVDLIQLALFHIQSRDGSRSLAVPLSFKPARRTSPSGRQRNGWFDVRRCGWLTGGSSR